MIMFSNFSSCLIISCSCCICYDSRTLYSHFNKQQLNNMEIINEMMLNSTNIFRLMPLFKLLPSPIMINNNSNNRTQKYNTNSKHENSQQNLHT